MPIGMAEKDAMQRASTAGGTGLAPLSDQTFVPEIY